MRSRDSLQGKIEPCSKRREVSTEKSVWRVVVFLEVEEGGQDPEEEAVQVYLIRFIADLPLSWYTGSVIESTFKIPIICGNIL